MHIRNRLASNYTNICCKMISTKSLKENCVVSSSLLPHMDLDGKTPAEKCGIKIEGNNKWFTLIQNASKKSIG